MEIRRGEIYFASLGENVGSEQSGTRPVLIVQNDIGNRFSPTVIVACTTSRLMKTQIPTHVQINSKKYGLNVDSIILCEQIKTLDKRRLMDKLTTLDSSDMKRIDVALKVSIGI